MKRQFLIALALLVLPLAFQAQPGTNPSSIAKGLPNWLGSFVAALIIGGIIFSILKG